MKLFSLLLLGVLRISNCGYPPSDNCTPGDQRCFRGTPQLCSPTQRWAPVDRRCDQVNATCCRTRAVTGESVYTCVPEAQCLPETAPRFVTIDGGT